MNKLKKLRKIFKIFKLDGYIVPKNDEFFGEYVDEGHDRLKYISSFSGSAGYAIILRNNSYLFVDGRYTLQAKKESGKNFKIIEIHKSKPSKILSKIIIKIKIGFDPKLFSEANLIKNFKTRNTSLIPIEQNLIDKIWSNRPKTKIKKFFLLNSKHAGRNYKNKLNTVCKILKKRKINKLLITAPENLAWLLNIRGKDSKYSPLPNCHAILDNKKKITLIVNEKKINNKFKQHFKNIINYINPSHINKYLDNLDHKKFFLIDKFSCSYFYKKLIEKRFLYDEKNDPIYILKAKKNSVEISNSIKSHILDGAALTKFIYWIKNNVNKFKITEISAEKKLEKFRKKSPNYQFPSFSTISGSGPNSAIIHYKASIKSNRTLKKGDLYLVDSGGQYSFGTTDVTRTISLDNNSKSIREIYTRILKGHIAVSDYKIRKNSKGSDIDRNARKSLKKVRLDYPHGTGHGVGYFLNVHEGPQSFSKKNKVNLKPGMIISNEPGYYKEGYFGIRIENLIYIKKNKFEELTMTPMEKDLIKKKMLNKKEIAWVNKYHTKVKKNLFKFMNLEEKANLIDACSPI